MAAATLLLAAAPADQAKALGIEDFQQLLDAQSVASPARAVIGEQMSGLFEYFSAARDESSRTATLVRLGPSVAGYSFLTVVCHVSDGEQTAKLENWSAGDTVAATGSILHISANQLDLRDCVLDRQ